MRQQEEATRSFGNLFPEMTPCRFCCITFVGSKSLAPAHTQGRWIIQKHESQEAEITGSHHESCPPHPASSARVFLFFHTRGRSLSQLVLGLECTSHMAHSPPSSLRSNVTSSLGLCLTAEFKIAVLHGPYSLPLLYFSPQHLASSTTLYFPVCSAASIRIQAPEGRDFCPFVSLSQCTHYLRPQYLEQCLVHSRYSVNECIPQAYNFQLFQHVAFSSKTIVGDSRYQT